MRSCKSLTLPFISLLLINALHLTTSTSIFTHLRNLPSSVSSSSSSSHSPSDSLTRLLKTKQRDFNHSYAVRKSDPNGQRLDNFGRTVSIKPGVAIVGSPEHDDNAIATDAGAVFVYIEDTTSGDWTLIRQIEDGEPGDYFGWSVALHTDHFAIIGACRGNTYGRFSGSAYYFNVETNPYVDQELPIAVIQSERHGSAFFGFTVAISEYSNKVRVAIGAYGHRGKGAVFMYTRGIDGRLGSEQILYGSDTVTDDNFGWSVSLYKNILVAGAPMANNQGAAYVFVDTSGSGSSYTVIDKLSQTVIEDDYNNPLYGDLYGMTVLAGEGFVAIAAPHNDVRGVDAGAVYVYIMDTDDMNPSTSLTTSATATATTPAPLTHSHSLSNSHHRKLYSFSQTLFAPSGHSYNRFGWSLSYDPIYHRVAIGNDFSKGNYIGEAYLFTLSSTYYLTLEETIYPRNSREEDDDQAEEEDDANFGYCVSIYGDYLAVGAELGRGITMLSGDVYFYKAQTYEPHLITHSPPLSVSVSLILSFSHILSTLSLPLLL
jgi:hypothetical protein